MRATPRCPGRYKSGLIRRPVERASRATAGPWQPRLRPHAPWSGGDGRAGRWPRHCQRTPGGESLRPLMRGCCWGWNGDRLIWPFPAGLIGGRDAL